MGPGFAAGVAALPPGEWSGPLRSGYGWHLVRVDAVRPAMVPSLDVVRDRVLQAVLEERRAWRLRETLKALRARYAVRVDSRWLRRWRKCVGRLAHVFLLALMALGLSAPALAHPLAPSLLEIVEREPGRAEVKWKTPAVVVPGSELRPVLPAHCRPVQDAGTEVIETAVVRRWEVACEEPLEGSSIEVSGIASSRADVILRVALADGRLFSTVLTEGRATFVVPARQRAVAVGWRYAVLGFDHIVTGYDHLLFVLGLLLVRNTGQLVATVTTFTAGHSVCLPWLPWALSPCRRGRSRH